MMDEDEPASKRSRTEENLIPEGIAVDNAADTHDLFGIQTRGGCACAGPFMQQLLGLSRHLVRRYRGRAGGGQQAGQGGTQARPQ